MLPMVIREHNLQLPRMVQAMAEESATVTEQESGRATGPDSGAEKMETWAEVTRVSVAAA